MADISDFPQRTKARIRPRSGEPLPIHIRAEIIEATKSDYQYETTKEDPIPDNDTTDLIPKGKSLVANINGTIVKVDPTLKNYRTSNYDLLKHEMKELIKDVLHKLEISVPLQKSWPSAQKSDGPCMTGQKGGTHRRRVPPQRNMQTQAQAKDTKS